MVFYRSFYEAMKQLEPQTKSDVFDAILEFGLNGNEIELNGIAKTVFILIKPQLTANIKRYENGMQPKRKRNANEKQNESRHETNENANENANDNDNENEDNKQHTKRKEKFEAPVLEEVKLFFSENGYKPDVAQNAFHYYNEAGWKDSRGKAIQNWKQKMRGVWFKDENKIVNSQNKPVYSTPTKYRPA